MSAHECCVCKRIALAREHEALAKESRGETADTEVWKTLQHFLCWDCGPGQLDPKMVKYWVAVQVDADTGNW